MNHKEARKSRPLIPIVLTAILLLLALLVVSGHARFTTDIFKLLPEEQRDPLAAAAMTQSREAFFNQITAVVSAPASDRDAAAKATRELREALKTAPLELREPGEQAARLRAAYLETPFRWLTSVTRDALQADAQNAFTQGLAANLARPGSFNAADPAGMTARFIAGLPAPDASWTLIHGMPARVAGGKVHFLVNASLSASPLDPAIQQATVDAFTRAQAIVEESCARCTLDWTGAVRFSKTAREAAQRDISRLSTAATLGIALLFIVAFRAFRPMLAAGGILLTSILAGLTASFAVFGSVHILTLVFGTTLLGLCIDYVVHFLVHRWAHANEDSAQALRAIRPGLALGLATSGTAFLFLLFAGFPALSQLAVFALTGLITAWALVNFGLGGMSGPSQADNVVARLARTSIRVSPAVRVALLAALGVAAIAGLPQLRIVDDVRGLQAAPDALLAEDRAARNAMQGLPGNTRSADFFLVEAETLDAALERESRLFAAAGQPRAFGLSRFLPSQAAREANLDAHAPLFADDARMLRDTLAQFGFRPALADKMATAYAAARSTPFGSEAILARPGFESLQLLYVKSSGKVGLIARIPDLRQVPASVEGVRLVQPLEDIENTFAAIRHHSVMAVAGAYLLMLLILSLRYGVIGGVQVLAPALFGAGLAIGLLGLAGLPLNIFSLVALILVLGIGADYALFLREASGHASTARLATAIAAATSLLSFGLLVFSSLPALRAFGFATGVGILGAFLAAPLAVWSPASRRQRPDEEILDRAA